MNSSTSHREAFACQHLKDESPKQRPWTSHLALLAISLAAQTFAVGMLGDKGLALAHLLMCLVFVIIDFVAFLLVPPLGRV